MDTKVLVSNALAQTLAKSTFNTTQRLKNNDSQQSMSVTIVGFSTEVAKYKVRLPDGGDRYADYIGNKALEIGQSVAAVFPSHSLYGWIDTKIS